MKLTLARCFVMGIILWIYIYIFIFIYICHCRLYLSFGMRTNHTNQALTQAFMETLFFLYPNNKQIIINHKEVGVPSSCQAFLFSFLTPSIRYYSFKKNYAKQTHAVMPKENLIVGRNTPINKIYSKFI